LHADIVVVVVVVVVVVARSGNEAVDWLERTLEVERGRAHLIGRELLKRGFFRSVTNEQDDFHDKPVLYAASTKQSLNTAFVWETPARNAEEVAASLLTKILAIYRSYTETYNAFGIDAMGVGTLLTDSAGTSLYQMQFMTLCFACVLACVVVVSPQFEEFQEAAAELQQVKLQDLQNDLQRGAFFLNIYNTLSLHSYIIEPSQMKGSLTTRIKFMKKFQYKVCLTQQVIHHPNPHPKLHQCVVDCCIASLCL
jgi:hypothetical protein